MCIYPLVHLDRFLEVSEQFLVLNMYDTKASYYYYYHINASTIVLCIILLQTFTIMCGTLTGIT